MSESSVEILSPDAFSYGGEAVGTLPGGKRCFVRGGAPGDTLKVRISADKKNYARAELLQVLKPSPDRTAPVCPFYGKCPGCSYQHVPYAVELAWKQKQFERFLVHKKLIAAEAVEPPCGAPARMGWRNKVRFTVQNGVRGYIASDNITLVPVTDCPLAEQPIRKWLASHPAPAEDGQETLRCDSSGTVHVITEENKNLRIREVLYGIAAMNVPAGSFFQINAAAFSMLTNHFQKILKQEKPELFAELFCGSGTFSMVAANAGVPRILGVELDPEAVSAAAENLKAAGCAHAKFHAGDAAVMFKRLRMEHEENAMLLVDPPRTGLTAPLIRSLQKASGIRTIVYVSCGPDTLARDLSMLTNWQTVSSRMFDMFPGTAHFESLTLLKRKA